MLKIARGIENLKLIEHSYSLLPHGSRSMRVSAHIRSLFPNGGERGEQMRQHLLTLWSTFETNGLVAGNFVEEFCSGDRQVSCQRYWETLLATT